MDNNKVLAVVNGKEVTGEDYNLFINSLDPQLKAYFTQEEYNKDIVNELVYQQLLYEEAIENGVDKEEDFLKVLEKTKQSMLKTYSLGKLLSTVEVTDEEMKDFYEKNKDLFKKGETAKASHILVDEEDKANEIYEKVKDGDNFAELAKKFSTCPSSERGGELGEFQKGQMVKEFEDAVFSNEVGTITEPVKTQFGYHIIRIDDKKDASTLSFDEAKDRIYNELKRKKEQEVYNNKVDELKEKYKVEIKNS